MTEFLVFMGFIALLIAYWAPARIRALRSGLTRWDSRYDSRRDSDRARSLHDLKFL